jgi:ribonucleoside-triphosphate reductase
MMLELKGDVYTCMGCRSFLTPDRFTDAGVGNISNAGNYVPGKHRYYGRFNQGVVTVNLVDIALSAVQAAGSAAGESARLEKFWEIFDARMALCRKALNCRHERLKGTLSDAAPILWQYGALARLEKGEKIDRLLFDGYSTISLGYAGLWECVLALNGKKLTEFEGEALGLDIMKRLNEYTAKWKAETNIDYSLYGTPLESTTYRFAKCLQERFGIVKGITDRNYITNSYHVHVTEEIDAFDKLALEAKFQKLSPGGAISYVEVPDMQSNIKAVLSIMQFIYDHIMYAELNTKSDYCQACGWNGEIVIVKDEQGKLIWKCPKCGNTDQNKMNVARRTCGYIGSQYWNQGRTQEIKERVLHVSQTMCGERDA